jgi:thioredoxin-related protein
MKKIGMVTVCVVLYFSSIGLAVAESINWQRYSAGVFQQAIKAQRPVLLFAMSETCHWCHKMSSTTFKDSTVVKLVNENYYPVILEVNQNEVAANKYKLDGVPTMIFFDLSGKIINIYAGYEEPQTMIRHLTASLPSN